MQTFAQKLFCAYLFCAILGLAHWAFAKAPQRDTMQIGIFYAKQPPYPSLIKLGEVAKNKSLFIQSIQSQKKDFVIYFDKTQPKKEI